jgi:hypothetical protein
LREAAASSAERTSLVPTLVPYEVGVTHTAGLVVGGAGGRFFLGGFAVGVGFGGVVMCLVDALGFAAAFLLRLGVGLGDFDGDALADGVSDGSSVTEVSPAGPLAPAGVPPPELPSSIQPTPPSDSTTATATPMAIGVTSLRP